MTGPFTEADVRTIDPRIRYSEQVTRILIFCRERHEGVKPVDAARVALREFPGGKITAPDPLRAQVKWEKWYMALCERAGIPYVPWTPRVDYRKEPHHRGLSEFSGDVPK